MHKIKVMNARRQNMSTNKVKKRLINHIEIQFSLYW